MAPEINVEQPREIVEAESHVWNLVFNSIVCSSLKCIVELNLPDTLHKHGRPMTLFELADAVSIDRAKADSFERILYTLIQSGFFTRDKKEGEWVYSLTPRSRILIEDHPFTLKRDFMLQLHPVMMDPYNHFKEWLQSDKATAFEAAHGMTLWEYMGKNPRFGDMFNGAMDRDTSLIVDSVMNDFKDVFSGLRSLVDVGGNKGTFTRAIAEAFPQIECIVLDLPHVVAGLEGTKNLKFVGGDMFKYIPAADAVMLKWILHDWNDEQCIQILKKCKEAITKGGKLIVIEMVAGNNERDNESVETQLFYDIAIMALLGGKERNEKEWEKLFLDAGFTGYKILPVLGSKSIIEVYP